MTFEEFWKQSGWHRPGEDPEVMGGAEYNLACDAWAAALASVEQAHTGPCSAGPFGASILLKDGTKVKLNRGENAHNAHVWLSVEPQAQIRPAKAPDSGTAVKYAANALSSVVMLHLEKALKLIGLPLPSESMKRIQCALLAEVEWRAQQITQSAAPPAAPEETR